MSENAPLEARKSAAEALFRDLQRRLVAELEAIEREAPQDLYPGEAGRFELTPWSREEGGGGTMGLLRGRVFEKAGVHVSKVHGVFSPEMAKTMPGALEDPRFFATGVSVIIHPLNPRMPTGHMNTRFIATTESWYGGGGDLTPWLEAQRDQAAPDAQTFHAAMRRACDAHDPGWYPKYKEECDEYFFLPHRGEARGVGGIFYDRHDSVGDAFLEAYTAISRRRLLEAWTEAEREEQLVRRGRYVEYNLLYDRGTIFGLKTGGNVQSILSSMPPVVRWP
jgi:coproporphyrinogen III oxidase